MIGVGAPWIFGAAVLAALATCVLHFISVRRPPVLLLPTMRFLPERSVRAVSRNARPSDLLLLLLRVLALLLAGAALSGMYWRSAGVKHGRIVVIQRSQSGSSESEREAALRAMHGAFAPDSVTHVVVIDTVAHVLSAAQSKAFNPETLSKVVAGITAATPTFSAAVLAATRAASLLVHEARNVDAIDFVIVAPFVRDWRDAAALSVRAGWPGTIRFNDSEGIADTSAAKSDYRKGRVTIVGAKASDAVYSAFDVRGWMVAGGSDANVTAESVTSSTGAAITPPISIEWPASGVPKGWTQSKPTTIGAVVARGEALVFPFARTAHIPDAVLAQGRALAWWSDGEVAAIEIPTATSCTRHVGIPVPGFSDVLQGQGARALLMALSAPCGGERDARALSADELRMLAGTGPAAPANAFKSAAVAQTPWAPLLLMLAVALLIAEWYVRDREDRAGIATDARLDSVRQVA